MGGVLFTHCNHLYFDRKQVRKMQPYPPLQTLVAAACVRREGWEAQLFDSTFHAPEEGFRRALRDQMPEVLVICEDHFNFLTKMCLVRNRELAFRMGQMAREAGIPVVVASSDASDNLVPYLKECADYVVLGEVEETLLELTRTLRRRRDPGKVRGIAYREPATGTLRINPKREPIQNLDTLPFPAWDLVDMEAYRNAWLGAHGEFSLNAISSRGCPFQCNWCAKPVFGSHYHVRSAKSVACEMQTLKSRFQPDHLWFADDIFALSPRWTREFAAVAERRQAQIPFKMQSRCDLMTRDSVAALRQAGCEEVWMGAESGSQRILDAMDKDIRVEEARAARENLRAHGIRACFFLQFGYPGETWEDIEATIRMVREAAPDDVGVSVSYPLPGTKFHQIVSAGMGAKANWRDSSDLAMLFRGEFSTGFYKALAEAVHAEVRGCGDADRAWRQVYELRDQELAEIAAV